MNYRSIASSVLALSAALSVTAHAQGQTATDRFSGLEEILVTAQKRTESVQDVPIAISAFSADTLLERAVTSVAGLSNITPNVSLDGGTPFSGTVGVLSAFIRGIGANDFAFNIDPGVGVYIDGIYLARSIGANQELNDVERVEILKGPQGTLFGRNTIGGAISIITRDPGKEFMFKGDVTTGSYDLIQVRGTADVPLTDNLTSSISFANKDRKGHVKRIPFPGVTDFNTEAITSFKAAGFDGAGLGREGGENTWNLRGKLKWDNGGPFTAVVSADYSKADNDQLANSLIKTVPFIFAGTYNCAIEGIIGAPECGVGPPSFAFVGGIGGLDTIVDLPSIFGVNVDNDPTNDRVPYDDRFLTGDPDVSFATGNNFSRTINYGFNATLTYDVSEQIELKSITGYRELDWDVGMDLDGSPLNFLHTSFTTDQKQFSQELQIIGNALEGALHYVGGAYYFTEKGNLHDFVTFAEGLLQVDGPNDLKTDNFAFFGQTDWRVNDLIAITVGARYTREKKFFEGFQSDANGLTFKILNFLGVPGCEDLVNISEQCRIAGGFPNPGEPLRFFIAGQQKQTFDNFAPRVAVQLHPADDMMIYGSWSRGYKTGGWTTRLSNPLDFAPSFREEEAGTFELGIKTELAERRVRLNAAVFQTNYDDIQLNFQEGISPTIQNAGDARIRGFEAEILALITEGFTINSSVGFLDSKYTQVAAGVNTPADPDPVFGRAGVIEGASLPKSPKWKFNISPRYEMMLPNEGRLAFLADYTYTSKMKNDTEGFFLLNRDATNVLNLSVRYEEPGGHWHLTVGGTNVLDDRYLVTGQAQFAGGQAYGTFSRPAEWYARFGVDF